MKCGLCGNEFKAKEMKLGRAGYKQLGGASGRDRHGFDLAPRDSKIVIVGPCCKEKGKK